MAAGDGVHPAWNKTNFVPFINVLIHLARVVRDTLFTPVHFSYLN